MLGLQLIHVSKRGPRLPGPKQTYQVESYEQTSAKFESKYDDFNSIKSKWRLQNGGHSAPASIMLHGAETGTPGGNLLSYSHDAAYCRQVASKVAEAWMGWQGFPSASNVWLLTLLRPQVIPTINDTWCNRLGNVPNDALTHIPLGSSWLNGTTSKGTRLNFV